MNRLPDFNQICMNITLWLVFFKVITGLKLPNLSQKCLFACYLMNRLADFNQIFIHITLWWWVNYVLVTFIWFSRSLPWLNLLNGLGGGRASVFSENTAIVDLYDICRSQWPILHGLVVLPHYVLLKSSDFTFLYFCTQKRFSFIGKAWFRWATLSCDSSYFDTGALVLQEPSLPMTPRK